MVLHGSNNASARGGPRAAREAARDAADSSIWEQARDALETHVPIGISLSLPNLPELRPIPAGSAGSVVTSQAIKKSTIAL